MTEPQPQLNGEARSISPRPVLGRRMARLGRLPNRFVRLLACQLPGLGVVVHRGRRTGRAYKTPVKLFRQGDHYLVGCVYGVDSDWVQNVLTAGHCELLTRRRQLTVHEVQLVHDEDQGVLPLLVRIVFRLLRISDFVRLRTKP